MVFDVSKISGIGEFELAAEGDSSFCRPESSRPSLRGSAPSTSLAGPVHRQKDPIAQQRQVYKVGSRAFLVVNKHTIEVRTDEKLRKLLIQKYESVMESRYFGRGGIEIVNSGQLKEDEIEDLVRLSYNLTKEME